MTDVRKGQGDVKLSREEFERRLRERFYDPSYYEPYATSHEALDRDSALHEEVRNAARTLVEAVRLQRAGQLPRPDHGGHAPRPK